MLNEKTFTCLIPAKGTSYRLPGKNLRLCNGIPLVKYPVLLAEKCGFFENIVVSTNSSEVAKATDADCIRRPDELATSDSSVWDAVKYTLREMKKQRTDYVVLLHPTSPCLNYRSVTYACLAMSEGKPDAIVGVNETSPYTFEEGHEKWKDFGKSATANVWKTRYCLNNSIFIASWKYLQAGKNIYDGDWRFFCIPNDEAIDIDDETDLQMAEAILQWRQKNEEENSQSAPRDIRTFQPPDEGKRRTPISPDG